MDNRDSLFFRNRSSITLNAGREFGRLGLWDHYIEFRPDEQPAVRGYRVDSLVYDDFAGIDLVHEYALAKNNEWLELDQYEFLMKDGRLEIRKKEAPDFGEFSPSQELDNFINTLNQGE